VHRARAGYLPKLGATGQTGYDWNRTGNNLKRDDSYSLKLQLTQPVFDGFRTRNAASAASSLARGAQETLRGTIQSLLLQTARAYAEVVANRALLDLNARYVDALKRELKLVKSLHAFGDSVASDVAEVEARLADAEGQESSAQAALAASSAFYEQATGQAPGKLAPARAVEELLPVSRQRALELAMDRHPAILAARHAVAQSKYRASAVNSEFWPTVDLVGTASATQSSGPASTDASVVAQFNLPIYRGGEVLARSRQAAYVSRQREFELKAAADTVRSQLLSAWSALDDAKIRERMSAVQVSASNAALRGAKAAYQIGERSIRDLLDAERSVLTAQTNSVVAQRDYVQATYAVAAAAGILEFEAVRNSLRQKKGVALVELKPLDRAASAFPVSKLAPTRSPKLRGCLDCQLRKKAAPLRASLED
jgi:outer membrane protein